MVRTCAAGGSRTLDFMHEQRTPYPLGQALRIRINLLLLFSPILITTFLPEAQRYVTIATLRGVVRPSSSNKSCNRHPVPLPGTALVRTTTTSMNLGRHVTGLPRGVVSPISAGAESICCCCVPILLTACPPPPPPRTSAVRGAMRPPKRINLTIELFFIYRGNDGLLALTKRNSGMTHLYRTSLFPYNYLHSN